MPIEAHITVTASPPPAPERPKDERPIGVRMIDLASKLGALLSEAHVIPTNGATPGAGLLSDIAVALTEGASSLLGKQALLRRLVDAYTAAGGEGVATLEAIEAAIKIGADPETKAALAAEDNLIACKVRLEALGKVFEEASGGKKPIMQNLKNAIRRGARP